jgi:hypothetical protein
LARDGFVKSLLAALAACCVIASARAEAVVETPLRDPWVPPELAKQGRLSAPSSGTELKREVDGKLRARFEKAAGPAGTLTREAARAAGLGFIERHFDAMDTRHSGRVGYEDYRRYLLSRGALLE